MAKGVGLIGNFKGKVGNTVGYTLKDSNNKQTQGIRVYQPVVRNPKTYAQAEQRMKLAPINATYRALKMIIDRGQEGLAYGNKSRLAWLSDAIKAFAGSYFDKGAAITAPALVPLTKGSLSVNVDVADEPSVCLIVLEGVTPASITTLGALSTALITAYPSLKDGDQITFVAITSNDNGFMSYYDSIVVDTKSTASLPSFLEVAEDQVEAFGHAGTHVAYSIIVSREGDNGQHLRTSASLKQTSNVDTSHIGSAAKEAAIESYMSQGANTDWAEESLMQ